MHDIVIRGGTILDGTGKAAFSGDVAIADGRVAAVGGKQGPARREIDATGLMVTPGWVDVHTHYDGQAMWDPLLAPSCWHGVTTVMFGNCGVGFAPVHKHHRGALMDLMEGVEEIPNAVLADGLIWDWESFPDFLDALERKPRAIDIAAQMAHLPLRVYVMGDRAVRREPATPDDIAEMRRLTIEGLRSGAFGFTTSRTDSHKTPDGELVPSRDADDLELMGIGTALNPFTVRPTYKPLESLPIEEQRRRLRDPELRRAILADKPSEAEIAKLAQFRQVVTRRFDKFFVMGNPPDYEPGPEKSVAAIAQREGRSPEEVAYDYMIEEGQYLYFPVVNYATGDHGPIHEMLNDPACLLGLSDGGAHCTSIIDAGMPSYMLAHWGRDRSRGPTLPLELLVKRQTSETSEFFGLNDRGRLAPGLRADVNVIDFDALKLHKPELVHDMPADGRRFIQRVEGYEATLVAGTPIFERGQHTGVMPGRLVRAGRNGEVVKAA